MIFFRKIIQAFWLWIAKSIAPSLARTPIIFGDNSRVSIAKSAKLVNALLNTQSGNITIKENVFFGHNVMLLTGSHDINQPGYLRAQAVIQGGRDIIIEESVWLTSNVIVIGPCKIGKNSILLPGSVVNSDVPENSVFGGIPAKFIKKLSDYEL